jgi:hypothetical protein
LKSQCDEEMAQHKTHNKQQTALWQEQGIAIIEGWLRLLGQKFFRDKWICLSG